jgi:rfaE bifunctional protein kinase chain/domain
MAVGGSHTGRALVDRLSGRTVVVIGDVMLDQFLIGRVNRISPEAPVPVVEFDHDEYRLGGAANVAHNIRALGGTPVLVGLCGRDLSGERLREQLKEAGIGSDVLVEDLSRPTTCKLRIVTTRRQQVARVDYEADREADGDVQAGLIATATAAIDGADIVVVSDYLKGVVTRAVMRAVVARCQTKNIPLLVDPKIPHLPYYAGATVITPNHVEAETATHRRIRTDDDAREAARAFRHLAQCQSVMVTRGEHGLWLLEASRVATPMTVAAALSAAAGADRSDRGERNDRADKVYSEPELLRELNLAAVAREVSDVTGAGDTVIATVAMGLAAGASLTEAATLANQAAGIAVARFGPTAVTQHDLRESFDA